MLLGFLCLSAVSARPEFSAVSLPLATTVVSRLYTVFDPFSPAPSPCRPPLLLPSRHYFAVELACSSVWHCSRPPLLRNGAHKNSELSATSPVRPALLQGSGLCCKWFEARAVDVDPILPFMHCDSSLVVMFSIDLVQDFVLVVFGPLFYAIYVLFCVFITIPPFAIV